MNVAIKQFLRSVEARNCSVNTVRAYEKVLNEFSTHLRDMPVKRIDRQQVREFIRYLGERGFGRKSIQRAMGAVRSFVKWLNAEGFIPVDVASGITTPKFPTHLPDLPSQAEMCTLLDGPLNTPFPERDRALLELLYATGIRVAEVCDIKLEDFEAPDVVIVRGKGKRERRVIYGRGLKLPWMHTCHATGNARRAHFDRLDSEDCPVSQLRPEHRTAGIECSKCWANPERSCRREGIGPKESIILTCCAVASRPTYTITAALSK